MLSEHYQKTCSHAAGEPERAVFLGLGFVSAQLQGFSNLRLRQRPMIGTTRQTQKSSLRIGCSFSSNAPGGFSSRHHRGFNREKSTETRCGMKPIYRVVDE
jgi:hypothetical protein